MDVLHQWLEAMDVRFNIKAPIFSRQGSNMFQAHSVLEGTCFIIIIFYNC